MTGQRGSEDAAALQRAFERHGYVVVKQIVPRESCRELREQILATFRALDGQSPGPVVRFLPPSVSFSVPDAWRALVADRMVSALEAVLEPGYTMIPDLQIQRNMYGSGRVAISRFTLPRRWGWHQDAVSEGFKPIHLDPTYRIVKCGLYLQENSLAYGGGIEIAPGSHRFPIRTGNSHRDWQLRLLAGKLGVLLNARAVPIEPGDAVIFDAFLWHCSSLPARWRKRQTAREQQLNVYPTPPEHTKLTMYFNAGRRAAAEAFLANSLARAKTEQESILRDPNGGELFFCDYLGLPFPNGYPAEFEERVRRRGLRVASLTGEALEAAQRVRENLFAHGRLWNVHRPESLAAV